MITIYGNWSMTSTSLKLNWLCESVNDMPQFERKIIIMKMHQWHASVCKKISIVRLIWKEINSKID